MLRRVWLHHDPVDQPWRKRRRGVAANDGGRPRGLQSGTKIPANLRIYVDTASFSGNEGQYAAAAIEDELLRHGDLLANDRTVANAVVLVRAGALSTDERSTTLGLQQFSIPFFPLGNFLTVPEFDLYKQAKVTGVAKFAATVYDPKSGKLIVSTNPQVGESTQSSWVVMLLFSWTHEDFTPPMGKRLYTFH